jgi:hypothetical protein
MFSMSHNNGVVTNLRGELLFEYEDSPLGEDDGGVGGFNHTLDLVKPVTTLLWPSVGVKPNTWKK